MELGRVVKQALAIEFVRDQLTSYGGLELLRHYFQLIGLNRRIRQGFREHDLGGDYGCVHLVLLVVGLLVVGARRLKQLRYVAQDPLFARLCGLARIPTDRTVVNWLKQFTQASLTALVRINSELLFEQITQLQLRRLTIDIDGTVIRTGDQVAWAMHGFNPHHPKDPNSAWQQLSILAHNLTVGFQLHTDLADRKPRSPKRTYAYTLSSMKTLRFTLIHRAARLALIHGRKVLRFSYNPATQLLYDQVLGRLAA
jgi:hypothetical protein